MEHNFKLLKQGYASGHLVFKETRRPCTVKLCVYEYQDCGKRYATKQVIDKPDILEETDLDYAMFLLGMDKEANNGK